MVRGIPFAKSQDRGVSARRQAALKGETEDQGRWRPLSGKRFQRQSRSRVSQPCGPLVEGNHVAVGLIITDLIGQTHHGIWVSQSCSLLKQLHGLSDTVLSAFRIVQE
jgi:hypothetical protein